MDGCNDLIQKWSEYELVNVPIKYATFRLAVRTMSCAAEELSKIISEKMAEKAVANNDKGNKKTVVRGDASVNITGLLKKVYDCITDMDELSFIVDEVNMKDLRKIEDACSHLISASVILTELNMQL